jgi:hypothetical protein
MIPKAICCLAGVPFRILFIDPGPRGPTMVFLSSITGLEHIALPSFFSGIEKIGKMGVT